MFHTHSVLKGIKV